MAKILLSDTEKKLRRERRLANLKPFGKGFNPLRNRNGRPKNFDHFRALAISLSQEPVKVGDKTIPAAEALLRRWRDSNEPILQKAFAEYAFGKVPDKLEATGLENKTTLVLHFGHERNATPLRGVDSLSDKQNVDGYLTNGGKNP